MLIIYRERGRDPSRSAVYSLAPIYGWERIIIEPFGYEYLGYLIRNITPQVALVEVRGHFKRVLNAVEHHLPIPLADWIAVQHSLVIHYDLFNSDDFHPFRLTELFTGIRHQIQILIGHPVFTSNLRQRTRIFPHYLVIDEMHRITYKEYTAFTEYTARHRIRVYYE